MTPAGMGFEGRRILVTGAARGIGRATAVWLARLGARVIAADIRDCDETLRLADGRVTAIRLDLTDGAGIGREFAALAAGGPVHGLANCAGLLLRRPLDETTEEEIARQIAVNQTGALLLARAALDHMIAGGAGGRIVLCTSQGAFTGGFHGSVPYSMTKAAVTALVKSLAREGAPHGVTVNAVAPGGADTAMLRDGMTDAALAAFRDRIPMGRFATPEEIAAPIAFLLGDWAGFITGATLHVNGGQLMV